jgi:Icc-related predicted phosphoesterase
VIDFARRRFIIVGDLQRTSRLELLRESNDPERRALMSAIAREHVDFVAQLGDMVFLGDAATDWRHFDDLVRVLRVPLLPVLGNHDYGLIARRALRNVHTRFPHLRERTFYSVDYGPLRIVFLDSNRRRMGRFDEQVRWLHETLAQYDRDPDVAGVLVLVHHPPFTNSSVTGDDLDVRNGFVPPFMAAEKTLAMISGHVHSYERFERRGKFFIVSGGGGGPRVRLLRAARRRHHDDLVAGGAVRPFHYLRIAMDEGLMRIESFGFDKGGSVAPIDALTVALRRVDSRIRAQ